MLRHGTELLPLLKPFSDQLMAPTPSGWGMSDRSQGPPSVKDSRWLSPTSVWDNARATRWAGRQTTAAPPGQEAAVRSIPTPLPRGPPLVFVL